MSISPPQSKIEPTTRPRPGHADLAGAIKYGQDDIRPIMERASARETAARVAAGAIAKRLLEEFGVELHSHTICIGGRWAQEMSPIDWARVENSPVRCADSKAEQVMIQAIDEARDAGDTVGGVFEVIASGVPIGLGSHVHWDRRLDGRIAQALMSINAVKGVEIGAGFALAEVRGSQAHDIIESIWRRASNRAGGLEGGISNGQAIVARAVLKPIPTLGRPLPSIDLGTGEKAEAHFERSDICRVPSAGVIGEAMLALVLAEALLEKFGGDHIQETQRNYRSYVDSIGRR